METSQKIVIRVAKVLSSGNSKQPPVQMGSN